MGRTKAGALDSGGTKRQPNASGGRGAGGRGGGGGDSCTQSPRLGSGARHNGMTGAGSPAQRVDTGENQILDSNSSDLHSTDAQLGRAGSGHRGKTCKM